ADLERAWSPGSGQSRPQHGEQRRHREHREVGAATGDADREHDHGDQRGGRGTRREDHARPTVAGPGTSSSILVTRSAGWMPEAHAAGVSVSRWASAATAISLTSSGVTKSRPESTATARE